MIIISIIVICFVLLRFDEIIKLKVQNGKINSFNVLVKPFLKSKWYIVFPFSLVAIVLIGAGNNPMVGMTVAVNEALNK